MVISDADDDDDDEWFVRWVKLWSREKNPNYLLVAYPSTSNVYVKTNKKAKKQESSWWSIKSESHTEQQRQTTDYNNKQQQMVVDHLYV